MKKIVFVGEAMLELTRANDEQFNKAFAGDVYNSSVYLKRAFTDLTVSFMSGVGTDSLSDEFVAKLDEENIDTAFLGRSTDSHLGIYMVTTDEHGERSFSYWRNSSAAKQVLTLLSEDQFNSLTSTDVFFFSGITLAILPPEQRVKFFTLLEKLRESNVKVIFDPNYRARLWEDKPTAIACLEQAFELSDWLMPGVEDFIDLYAFTTVEEVIAFCSKYQFEELVIKQGAEAVHVVTESEHKILPVVPSERVVDTTSAGDAFNGVYLGARLTGETCEKACELASYLAARVVETPGAIMKSEVFENNWAKRPR